MSGPKVVRIVTREEIIAICEGHLARVAAALDEWVRVGRRNDYLSDNEIAAGQARLMQLQALLKADRFADLQKQASQEVAFLQADQDSRLAKVVAAAAQARSVERRQAEAAQALLGALQRAGKPIEPQLLSALRAAGSGMADPKALAQGFALLANQPSEQLEARRALADRLKDGDRVQSLASWIASQPRDASQTALKRLDDRLAELTLLAPEVGESFEARLKLVLEEVDVSRRGLLMDSLEVELGRALAQARGRAKQVNELRLLLAELKQASVPEYEELVRQGASAELSTAELLEAAATALRMQRDRLAASARRAAVLQSLAGLGYEVGAELSTAWVNEGRVVLRKAAQPQYGVEISGDPAAVRMQMRVVAFDNDGVGPDPARDADAETIWCSDVTTLQAQLATAGGNLVIERALPVGATPLKRIALAEGLNRVAREGPTQQAKTLP